MSVFALELNNKTVAKAYGLLERDSVIQTRGYRGTFIHPDAKANSQVDLNAEYRRQHIPQIAHANVKQRSAIEF